VGCGDWLAGGEGWVEPLPQGCGKRVEVLADGVVNCGAGGAEEVCSRQQRTRWGGQGGGNLSVLASRNRIVGSVADGQILIVESPPWLSSVRCS
jgi:hypothetical protein